MTVLIREDSSNTQGTMIISLPQIIVLGALAFIHCKECTKPTVTECMSI